MKRERFGFGAMACTLALLACSGGKASQPVPPGGGGVLPGDPALCPAGFQAALPAGQHGGFASAGQSRSFRLLLPGAAFSGPRPLLFAFHGTGMSGAGAISSYGLQEWVAKGFIVVAPDSNGNGTVWPVWDALSFPGEPPRTNADLVLFDELLQCVAGHHEVDAKRVYVAGHSAGGAMTHFMLGRRSSLLAGGIAASGAFDLTQPVPAGTITPMLVIVTWGGANDFYGGSAGGSSIESVGYAEQSAIASQYWEGRPGNHQIACSGANVGHAWLGSIGGWMADLLLAHPKGSAVIAGETLPALPGGAQATCSEAAATYVSPITVACSASTVAGCQAYCQLLGDCLVENGTLGPPAAEQIADLGFAASGDVCAGCVGACQADASGSAADATVLGCVSAAAPSTTCGPGFAGAAVFSTLSTCCQGATGSAVCGRLCATFGQSPLFAPMLPACP